MSADVCTRCGPSELTNWHLIHGRPSTETGPMGHQQLRHLHLKYRKKPRFPPAHSLESLGDGKSEFKAS